MPDYYPILDRAISGLATDNPQTRQKLYEHGRTILMAHLRRNDPEISAAETISHRVAFEAAILRLEARSQSVRKSFPKAFEDCLPLNNTNNTPDIASLLRQPAEVC